MSRRILVCGLPGAGKTTFAKKLATFLGALHVDGDEARAGDDDWDFTDAGRVRQAMRMRELTERRERGLSIASFVCPTDETRAAFNADFTIFLSTLTHSRFPDTDAIFVPPKNPELTLRRTAELNAVSLVAATVQEQMPQGAMIGRFQPWHDGHLALFKSVLERSGYVGIGVRSMPRGPSNPDPVGVVSDRIYQALTPNFSGCFHTYTVPNVSGVYYGRDVGYEVARILLPPEVEAIRARDLRRAMD